MDVISAPQTINAAGDGREAVEHEWLAAGQRGDVAALTRLRQSHPRWLALDRVMEQPGISPRDETEPPPPPPPSRVSDWSGFRLRTLGASAIHAAVWAGSESVLRFLLEEGQSADTRDDWHMTPLMVAVLRHTLPLLRSVFRGREIVPRHLAVDCRQEDADRVEVTLAIVKLLLQSGADLEARNHDGKTALMLAANDDAFEVAKLLLETSADVDAQDHNGYSALRHSVDAKSLLALNLLLEHRADLDLCDATGTSPLTVVITRSLVNQLQIILNHHALVVTALRLDFAGAVLMEAVDRDAITVAQFLLESEYVLAEYQNANGETAFHDVQSSRAVELLCRFDAGWTAFRLRTTTGDSCLHYAARLGSHRVLNALLEHHERMRVHVTDDLVASVNADGATPLFVAAMNTAIPLKSRDTKTELLLSFNAPLFPADWPPWLISPRSRSRLSLVVPVRACLRVWLLEASNNRMSDELVSLNVKWIASVSFAERQSCLLSGELLGLVVFAGYAADLVPLLVELPFEHSSVSRFLHALQSFAALRVHRLLGILHRKLVTDLVTG